MARRWTFLLACAALAACGRQPHDTDSGMPMRDAGPPPDPPAPIDCAAEPIARFSGSVMALTDRVPMEGAHVCVLDHPEIPCAATDALGSYALACAPPGDAAISFEAAGFAPGVWLWNGRAGAPPQDLSVSLVRDAENTAYLAPAGVTYPDGASALVTIDLVGDVAGLMAALRTGEGEGPFYSADEGARVDPAATSAAGEGEFVFFLARPDPGWSEIEIELVPANGATCTQLEGAWSARDGAPNVIRVPIRPGTESVIWVRC
jgi:hypothetical protein